ncbi:GyrI-like domain-containing protein [Flavobacterium sp. RHBU_3]|uniref:GyrI-like domain-containing protein n=1 Tax=Flavobacterium sp. RHBU_3 TaxID=3391184 RepID=UPI00398547DB
MNTGINLSLPEITTFPETRLVGMHSTMSFAQNTTPLLWQTFMPRRKEVPAVDANLFSVQLYPQGFFEQFNPNAHFEKWAAVAVPNDAVVPQGMDALTLPGGLYAVFHYKGNPTNGSEVFRYILGEWLPQSGYTLDARPHFEILGERYKNNSDDSEEDIYIPICV